MSVITVRVDPTLKKRLEQVVKERGLQSISEAVNAAIEEFVLQERMKWKSRQEVRLYFGSRKRLLKGLEEVHVEEGL